MFEPWSSRKFTAWKWLEVNWNYSISPKSIVLTDTDMLGGHAKAEVACRFSENYWEIYSRQPEEIDEKYKRISPLGTLLAIHADLEDVIDLRVGQAVERLQCRGQWFPWNGNGHR